MRVFTTSALEVLQHNSRFILEQALESIRLAGPDEASGLAYVNAAYHYRTLAVCELLFEANAHRCFGFLCKSAQVRLQFLKRVAAGHGADARYLCTSHNFPFADALAAGDFSTAYNIAILSPQQPLREVEYVDDFLRFHFLHLLCRKVYAAEDPDLDSVLEQWETVLEGGEDYYLAVCKALWHRDVDRFSDALGELVAQRKNKMAVLKQDDTTDDQIWLSQAPVFMNGLALIRLAEALDLTIDDEFDTIPEVGHLLPSFTPPPQDNWRLPEAGMPVV